MNRQDVTIKEEPPDESDSEGSSSSFEEDGGEATWWVDDGIVLPDLGGSKSGNSISDGSLLLDLDDDLPDIVPDSQSGEDEIFIPSEPREYDCTRAEDELASKECSMQCVQQHSAEDVESCSNSEKDAIRETGKRTSQHEAELVANRSTSRIEPKIQESTTLKTGGSFTMGHINVQGTCSTGSNKLIIAENINSNDRNKDNDVAHVNNSSCKEQNSVENFKSLVGNKENINSGDGSKQSSLKSINSAGNTIRNVGESGNVGVTSEQNTVEGRRCEVIDEQSMDSAECLGIATYDEAIINEEENGLTVVVTSRSNACINHNKSNDTSVYSETSNTCDPEMHQSNCNGKSPYRFDDRDIADVSDSLSYLWYQVVNREEYFRSISPSQPREVSTGTAGHDALADSTPYIAANIDYSVFCIAKDCVIIKPETNSENGIYPENIGHYNDNMPNMSELSVTETTNLGEGDVSTVCLEHRHSCGNINKSSSLLPTVPGHRGAGDASIIQLTQGSNQDVSTCTTPEVPSIELQPSENRSENKEIGQMDENSNQTRMSVLQSSDTSICHDTLNDHRKDTPDFELDFTRHSRNCRNKDVHSSTSNDHQCAIDNASNLTDVILEQGECSLHEDNQSVLPDNGHSREMSSLTDSLSDHMITEKCATTSETVINNEHETTDDGITRNTCIFSINSRKNSSGNRISQCVNVRAEEENDLTDNINKGDTSMDCNTSISDCNSSFESDKSSRKETCVYRILGSLAHYCESKTHKIVKKADVSGTEDSRETIEQNCDPHLEMRELVNRDKSNLLSIENNINSASTLWVNSNELHEKATSKVFRNVFNDVFFSDISEAENSQEKIHSHPLLSKDTPGYEYSGMEASNRYVSNQTAVRNSEFHFSDISDDECADLENRLKSSVEEQSIFDRSTVNTSIETQFHFSDISDDEQESEPVFYKGDTATYSEIHKSKAFVHQSSDTQRKQSTVNSQSKNIKNLKDFYNRNNNASPSQYQANRICKKYKFRRSPGKATGRDFAISTQSKLAGYYSDITEDSNAVSSELDMQPKTTLDKIGGKNLKKNLRKNKSHVGIHRNLRLMNGFDNNSDCVGYESNCSDTSQEISKTDSIPAHYGTEKSPQNFYSDISSDSEMSSAGECKSRNNSRVIEYSEEEENNDDSHTIRKVPRRSKSPSKLEINCKTSAKLDHCPDQKMSDFIVSDSENDVESVDFEADSESLCDREDFSDVVEDKNEASNKPMENGFVQTVKDHTVACSSNAAIVSSESYHSGIVNKMVTKYDDVDSGISDNSTTKSCDLRTHSFDGVVRSKKHEKDSTCESNTYFVHEHSDSFANKCGDECSGQIEDTEDGKNSRILGLSQSIPETLVTSEKSVVVHVVEPEADNCSVELIIEETPGLAVDDILDEVENHSSTYIETETNGTVIEDIPKKNVSKFPVSESTDILQNLPKDVLISASKNVVISPMWRSDTHCKRITLLGTARHVELLTLESTGDEKSLSSADNVQSDDLSGETDSGESYFGDKTACSTDLQNSTVDSTINSDGSVTSTSEAMFQIKSSRHIDLQCKKSRDISQPSNQQENSSSRGHKRKVDYMLAGQCAKLKLNAVVKIRKLSHSKFVKITAAGNGKSTEAAGEEERLKKSRGESRHNEHALQPVSVEVPSVRDCHSVGRSNQEETSGIQSKEKRASHPELADKVSSANEFKNLKCVVCSKSYTTKADLSRHFTKAHAGINVNKPHKCTVCGRGFTTRYRLTSHLSVHTGEKPFECVFCGKGFRKRSHLESHQTVHTGLKLYTCDLCFESFAHRQSYKDHLAVHQGNPRKYQCDICNKSVECLTRHRLTHTGELPYGCDNCDERFATKRELKTHKGKHSSHRTYVCKLCNDKFKTKACRKVHMKCHSGASPYKCDLCEHSFSCQNLLKLHLKAHTGEKPFTCIQCGLCFSQRTRLETHSLVHLLKKNHNCEECGKTFARNLYLLRHQRVHLLEKQHSCQKCGKTFQNSSELESHDLAEHKGQPSKAQIPCNLCDRLVVNMKQHMQSHREEKSFVCKLCHKQLADQRTLKNHMLIHTGEKPVQCHECGKCFRFRSVLKNHLLIHSDEYPFKCTACSYCCRDASSLLKHFRKHSGVLPFACEYDGCGRKFTTGSARNLHHKVHADKREYKCSQCDKTFNTSSTLNTHMKLHSGIKPYACHLCDKAFIQSTHLKSHLLSHTGERPFPCDKCNRKFRTSSQLKAHKLSHTGEKSHRCSMCPAEYSTKGSLQMHIKLKHCPTGENKTLRYDCQKCGYSTLRKQVLVQHVQEFHEGKKAEKNFICTVPGCNVKCRHPSSLRQHMSLTHSNDRPFVCTVCEKRCKSKASLQLHMRIHTGELPFKCTQCDKQFSQRSNLRTHLVIHSDEKKFKCHLCDLRFKRSHCVKSHIKRVHDKRQIHECKKCGEKFRTKDGFRNHMNKHNGIAPKRLPCPFCDKTYSRRDGLEYHLKSHTGERPYVCNECGAAFAGKQVLTIHARTHTGEKPFQCKECGKGFSQPTHLRIHIKGVHKGIKTNTYVSKPVKCELCDKVFSRRNGLLYHMKVHNDEKPYACSYCDMTFRSATILRGHERTHTGAKPYRCNQCDKRFSRWDTLKEHERLHTGERLKCKHCPKLFKNYQARANHKCDPLCESKESSDD